MRKVAIKKLAWNLGGQRIARVISTAHIGDIATHDYRLSNFWNNYFST